MMPVLTPAVTTSLWPVSPLVGTSGGSGTSAPDGALVDRGGNYILDRSGNYIVTVTAPRTS